MRDESISKICEVLIQVKKSRLNILEGYVLNDHLQRFEVEPLRKEIAKLEKIITQL